MGSNALRNAKQGVQDITNKAGDIKVPNLSPFNPQHQLSPVGPVPYNVYDGYNLRDQLLIKAEQFSAGGKSNRDVKGIDNPLLPDEGKVGTYEELIDAGTRGDNITPHHMPSAKYMKTNVEVHKNDGVSMNMEHPHPGKGGRHRQTETYGMTGKKLEDYLNLEPRDVLARDIIDARNIYIKEGLYTPEVRSGLLEVIKLNKTKYPNVFER